MLNINKLRNPSGFLEEFMKEYLLRGLGSMQKRDVEILFVHLLMQDKVYGEEVDYYRLSHDLCISESRIKRLIYDSQIRYQSYTEEQAKEDFIDLLKSSSFFVDKNKRLNFMIRKPMLRQYFEEWVSRFSGLIDSSFNGNFVKVSIDDLSKVIDGLTENKSRIELIKKNLDNPKPGLSPSKYICQFLKKFISDPECSIEFGALVLKQVVFG